MASDLLDRLRALALEGIPETPAPAAVRRRARAPAGPPMAAPDATPPTREELPGILLDEAARVWRQHTQAWTPTLSVLAALAIEHVRVDRGCVVVTLKNGTHRSKPLPPQWISVIVAALTGRELPEVRRRLRASEAVTPRT